ncbi:hypothetical protein PMAYCL1PPCAC_01389, partial [Pristionchus mayeri]
ATDAFERSSLILRFISRPHTLSDFREWQKRIKVHIHPSHVVKVDDGVNDDEIKLVYLSPEEASEAASFFEGINWEGIGLICLKKIDLEVVESLSPHNMFVVVREDHI